MLSLSGFAGRLLALRPPFPQVAVALLTVSALAGMFFVPRLREWADHVSIRSLAALHLCRFVGIYFLVLAQHGLLSPAFAIPAGWGDTTVAILAAVLLLSVDPAFATGRRLYLVWNALGLLDILFVVANAARVALSAPASMQELLRLPLSLLPTFLVPIIITSHVLFFQRLIPLRAKASATS